MRVLYAGAGLAGVTTSVRALAKAKGLATSGSRFYGRVGFVTNDDEVWTDARTNLYFESLEAPLSRCRTETNDPTLQHLRPLFDAHAEYLRTIEGVVFVADSQIERREANLESLERLERDLRHVGRDPTSIGVVFACNKQDLPRARPIAELSKELRWPRCAHIGASASSGAGVVAAFEALTTF